uniref:DUF2127 domain-containing protein n=1 Tax=Thermofilum pendens TaxID=2269 RepID=A0A7J3X996_THEPE
MTGEGAATPPPHLPLPPPARPLGVTVLAVLGFIFGTLALLLGLVFIALAPVIKSMLYSFPLPMSLEVLLGILEAALLVGGAVTLPISWGLWIGKKRAWWLTVVIYVLNLLSSLASLTKGDATGIAPLLISALILYYFFKPQVKAYFGVKVGFST